MKVLIRERDLSDEYIHFAQQIASAYAVGYVRALVAALRA
jgi:hypothetical protein